MFIVANLKSVMNLTEMNSYVDKLDTYQHLIIAPSSSYFHLFDNSKYLVASQDISCSKNAYTGEITGEQLVDMNIPYVLVGHGERREHFKEDESLFVKKILNAISNNLKVVYFIGEDQESSLDEVKVMLEEQIAKVFNDIKYQDISNIIVAYEPFWAIGDKNKLSKSEIEEIVLFIKNIVNNYYNVDIKVIYGGGLNMDDINLLSKSNIIDGFAISKIAIDVDNLNKIINLVDTI